MVKEGWVYITSDGYYVQSGAIHVRAEIATVTDHQRFVSKLDEATLFDKPAPPEDQFQSLKATQNVTVHITVQKVV